MSSENTGVEILDQYRNISAKLKKRFFKKPNISDACESYKSLAKQCEDLELPNYAGICWSSASKSEDSLGNSLLENAYMLQSARQFAKAEIKDFNLGYPSTSADNMQASLGNYSTALTKCLNESPAAIGVNLEIVQFLEKINRTEYVDSFLKDALNLSESYADTKIHCLLLLANNLISNRDYVGALETFTEVSRMLQALPQNGYRSGVLLRCEINTVLLLLVLRPVPQKLPAHWAKILEKYTWGDKSDSSLKACKMSESLFLLLESLVTICQSFDTTDLIALESQLWPFLTKEEKDLLRILVQLHTS